MTLYSIKKRYSTLFFRVALLVSSMFERSPSLACGMKTRGIIKAATAVKTKVRTVGSLDGSRFMLIYMHEIRATKAMSET